MSSVPVHLMSFCLCTLRINNSVAKSLNNTWLMFKTRHCRRNFSPFGSSVEVGDGGVSPSTSWTVSCSASSHIAMSCTHSINPPANRNEQIMSPTAVTQQKINFWIAPWTQDVERRSVKRTTHISRGTAAKPLMLLTQQHLRVVRVVLYGQRSDQQVNQLGFVLQVRNRWISWRAQYV